ncbi:MAG: hypothetical protein WAM97_07085 [Acidimicrobiales bacterium]
MRVSRSRRRIGHRSRLVGTGVLATIAGSLVLVAVLIACVSEFGSSGTSGAINAPSGSTSATALARSNIDNAGDRSQTLQSDSALAAGPLVGSDMQYETASDNLPADCIPNNSGPPGSSYQLGVVGYVTNGTLTAGPTTVANINAKFCGVVTVVSGTPPCNATGTVDSPPDGQMFGSLSAALNLIPGMQQTVPFTAVPGTITGSFQCNTSGSGLEVTVNATVGGTTGLFGLSCTVGPIDLTLTGTLTGPISDPNQYATVTLTGDQFAIPAVQASPACSGEIPTNLNEIAGLPISPGGASATLPTSVTLYQPTT